MTLLLIAIWSAFGLAGWRFGARTGHPVTGLILGLLLGVFLPVTVALVPSQPRR